MKLKKIRQQNALEMLRTQMAVGSKQNKGEMTKLTDNDIKRITAEIAILEKRV